MYQRAVGTTLRTAELWYPVHARDLGSFLPLPVPIIIGSPIPPFSFENFLPISYLSSINVTITVHHGIPSSMCLLASPLALSTRVSSPIFLPLVLCLFPRGIIANTDCIPQRIRPENTSHHALHPRSRSFGVWWRFLIKGKNPKNSTLSVPLLV